MRRSARTARTLPVAAATLALCCTGCFGPHRTWTDDLVWSPDGRHAAVIAGGDLYLTDATGTLSPRLASGVYRVGWLSDSQRLVVARERHVATFAAIASAIGPAKARDLAARAEHMWGHIQHPEWPEEIGPGTGFADSDATAAGLYLRERYGEAIRGRFPDDWEALEHATAALHSVTVGRAARDRIEWLTTLSDGLIPVREIRPAPGGRAVAFATENEELFVDGTIRIHVVATDGSAPPVLVGEDTGRFPDWTPDSRSLVYYSASGTDANIGSLGCIETRQVADAAGTVLPEPGNPSCLVDVIFDPGDLVRCLRDGRLIFEGNEVRFPDSSETFLEVPGDERTVWIRIQRSDGPRQLYSFDPVTRAAPRPIVPLWQVERDALVFFNVSPDLTRVVYGTSKGRLRLLTLADGRSEELPLGLSAESGYVLRDVPLAVWSGPGALTYMKRIGARNEYILRRGNAEIIFSRDWPDGMVWPLPPDR